jgi:thioredoxin-like negative regulator of GroEL
MTAPTDDPARPGEPAAADAAAAAAPGGDEPAAWAELQARWDDPAAHRAYLARFADLDGLTTAGRRYREVLAARPEDAQALAMKGEILKRATVVGLASLPRTTPARLADRVPRWARWTLATWLGSAVAWLLYQLFTGQP